MKKKRDLEVEIKNLNAANKELTTYSDKFTAQTNYSDFLSNLDKLAKDAGIKAKKIPETVLENIKAGNYKAPTTGDGLKRLINLDGLIQQAQEAGIEIPQYLLQCSRKSWHFWKRNSGRTSSKYHARQNQC